jgi:putative ABC transport system permease protein
MNNTHLFTNLKLAAGRNMAQSDTIREFLVNEALVAKLGIANPKDALGKQIALGQICQRQNSGGAEELS